MPRLILIAGGTASGKSTIAARLKVCLNGFSVAAFSHDHYYKDLSHLTKEEHDEYNFDHPDAIDAVSLVSDLKILLTGISISIPIYDYSTYTRSRERHLVPASDIIIIEGIFALYYRALTDLADIKIYVDTIPDLRFKRRTHRDTADRGYSMDEVTDRYFKTVKPMHDLYVEPTRCTADIVVNGSDNINFICEEIMCKIPDIFK